MPEHLGYLFKIYDLFLVDSQSPLRCFLLLIRIKHFSGVRFGGSLLFTDTRGR